MKRYFLITFITFLLITNSYSKSINKNSHQMISQSEINRISQIAIEKTLVNDPDFFKNNINTIVNKSTYEIGDTASFYAFSYEDSTIYVTDAIFAAKGKNINIWIEVKSIENGLINDDQCDSLIYYFDEKSLPNSIHPSKSIYSIDTTYFGTPPNFDGDGVVDCLILDIYYFGGYFNENDQQPYLENNGSNARDMIYISATSPLSFQINTLAHELQHLIQSKYDFMNEDVWLREGMATLAEVYCGFSMYPKFFLQNPNNDFINWGEHIDYSQVQLMAVYMSEQFGHEFIKKVSQSPYHGTTSLGYVFYEMNIDMTVPEFFKNWIICNYINDVSVNPKWGYNHPDLQGLHAKLKRDFWEYPLDYTGEYLYPAGTNYFKFNIGDTLSFKLNSDYALGQLIRYFENGKIDVVDINPGENFIDNNFDGSIIHRVMAISTMENFTDFSFSTTMKNSGYDYAELGYDDEIEDNLPNSSSSYFGITSNRMNRGFSNYFELSDDSNWEPIALKLLCSNVQNGKINLHIWDDDNGKPGKDLITPIPATLIDGWNDVMIETDDLEVLPQKFHLGYLHQTDETKIFVGTDNSFKYNKTHFVYYNDTSYTSKKFSELNGGAYKGYNLMMHAVIRSANTTEITEELYPVAEQFSLSQNFPNPFNPTTQIAFNLPCQSDVRLCIYDCNGRKIHTLANDHRKEGYHSIIWDATNFSSGVYFYRLDAGNFSKTRKMLLLK